MVNDALLSPLLLQMAVYSTIDATERTVGASSLRVSGEVEFQDAPSPVLLDNMFAGEMVFILIALVTLTQGFAGLSTVGGWVGAIGSLVLGITWSLFDLFIGFLQAFIFMILTVVYLAQASEHH